jgi:hypothetical protein
MDFQDKKGRIGKGLQLGGRYIQKLLNKENYQFVLQE